MNRWTALLLAVIGGAAIALGIMIALAAAVGGILWLYVFGDDPWPSEVETALNIAVPLIGLLLWAVAARLIWLRLTRT